MTVRVVAIMQARMGSTRLPGKVLLPLLAQPLLWWDVYRVRKSRLIDEVVIATTTHHRDSVIVELAQREGWAFFCGSEDDVLDRYFQCVHAYKADIVVRITSDCPLIDPSVIDYAVAAFLSAAPQVDYISNTLLRTYPRGLDVEVLSTQVLAEAWHADKSAWREHVTPYIYANPNRFKLSAVQNPVDYSHYRWTVDTPEDYALVQKIYQHFDHGDFGWQDVIQVLEQHPEWVALNAHISQKSL